VNSRSTRHPYNRSFTLPFILKERRGRNPRKTKGYICLFVCLVTSAIHLELATDLSTDTFLACLRCFMSLRGKCSQIFNDNGTNFVGDKRALDEMQQFLSSQEHQRNLTQSLANDGIKWSFIPPHSPHYVLLNCICVELWEKLFLPLNKCKL